MSEAQPNMTEPKKMFNRNVAAILGAACIVVLVFSLVGAYAYYTPIINGKNDKLSSLDSQVASLNNQIAEQNNTISSLETNMTTLQEQTKNIHILGAENPPYFWLYNQTGGLVSNLTRFLATGEEVLGGTPGNVSSGYIVVWISTDNNNTSTYVQVYGENYNQTINVGSGGIAIFPIPAGIFGVIVGISEGEATVTFSEMYVH
jgi:hypothetical protein